MLYIPVPSKRRHANGTSELNTTRSRMRVSWSRKQGKCYRLLSGFGHPTDGWGSAPFRLRQIKIIAISLLFALNVMSASSKVSSHRITQGPMIERMMAGPQESPGPDSASSIRDSSASWTLRRWADRTSHRTLRGGCRPSALLLYLSDHVPLRTGTRGDPPLRSL